MPGSPPAAFAELVQARSTALHRTALLLARDEHDAREILEEALARARRTWDRNQGQPEAYCRSMLARVATSRTRRRRHPRTAPDGSLGSPTAVLRALTPRQRAVLVLRHFHGYTLEQAAEALDITVSKAEVEENAALAALGHRDLSGTLDAIADAVPTPDAVTLLAGSQSRALQIGRRRRAVLAMVAAVVVLLGGAGIALDEPGDERDRDLDGPDLAVPDPSYDQGYGFQDGVPRPFTLDGLKLIVSHEIAPGGVWSTGFPATTAGNPVYAVAWCTGAADDVPVTMTAHDAAVLPLPCTQASDQQTLPVRPLPVEAGLWRVINPLPGPALVAVYEEATWGEFPFAQSAHRLSWNPPLTGSGSIVIDSTSPVISRPDLEALAGTSLAYSATVPMTAQSRADIDVILNGPGQALVTFDGIVVTDDWSGPDPDLRDTFVHNFEPGLRRHVISLDSPAMRDLGLDLSDGEVVVSVVPRAVAPQDWAVQVVTSDAARTSLGPLMSVLQRDGRWSS